MDFNTHFPNIFYNGDLCTVTSYPITALKHIAVTSYPLTTLKHIAVTSYPITALKHIAVTSYPITALQHTCVHLCRCYQNFIIFIIFMCDKREHAHLLILTAL